MACRSRQAFNMLMPLEDPHEGERLRRTHDWNNAPNRSMAHALSAPERSARLSVVWLIGAAIGCSAHEDRQPPVRLPSDEGIGLRSRRPYVTGSKSVARA